MRFQACLPPSWWEFSLDHTTHIYNRTPMRHLEWRTPHEWFTGERPSIGRLQVLGCGAYVFIPSEIRENKMAPKAELMVFLGMHSGGKGYIFVRRPNNIVFSAAHATFDKSLFPRCPKKTLQNNTSLVAAMTVIVLSLIWRMMTRLTSIPECQGRLYRRPKKSWIGGCKMLGLHPHNNTV